MQATKRNTKKNEENVEETDKFKQEKENQNNKAIEKKRSCS